MGLWWNIRYRVLPVVLACTAWAATMVWLTGCSKEPPDVQVLVEDTYIDSAWLSTPRRVTLVKDLETGRIGTMPGRLGEEGDTLTVNVESVRWR